MRPKWIDWIHPSYRDLVIEELSNDPGLQLEFLQAMSLQGIKLAISDSGGATGNLQLPLMASPRSWELFHKRCMELIAEGPTTEISELLEVLRSVALQAPEVDIRSRLVQIITSVCEEARDKWDQSGTVLTVDELSAYCEVSLLVSPLPALPRLEASWRAAERSLRKGFEESEKWGYLAEPDLLKNCVELAVIIQENEPRFLRQIGFPEKYAGDITRLLDLVKGELQEHTILDSAEELRAEAERLDSLAEILEALSSLMTGHRKRFKGKRVKEDLAARSTRTSETLPSLTLPHHKRFKELAAELADKASSLREEARELEPPEPDDDYDSDRDLRDTFDIEGLFSDL